MCDIMHTFSLLMWHITNTSIFVLKTARIRTLNAVVENHIHNAPKKVFKEKLWPLCLLYLEHTKCPLHNGHPAWPWFCVVHGLHKQESTHSQVLTELWPPSSWCKDRWIPSTPLLRVCNTEKRGHWLTSLQESGRQSSWTAEDCKGCSPNENALSDLEVWFIRGTNSPYLI